MGEDILEEGEIERREKRSKKGGKEWRNWVLFLTASHTSTVALYASDDTESRRRWFIDMEYVKKKDAAMEINTDVRVMLSQSKEPVTEDHCWVRKRQGKNSSSRALVLDTQVPES